MKIYVTFGFGHIHKVDGVTFDRNCIASIECEDYVDGREKTFNLFGPKFCTTYDSPDDIGMEYYPRGVIEVKSNLENKDEHPERIV